MSRKEKAINSVKWSTISAIFGGLLGPLGYIVKARYLSPSEIGVLAVLIVIIGVFVQIITSSFSQALVEVDEIDDQSFSSFFYLNVCFSFLIVLLIYLLAPLVEGIYEMNGLKLLMRLSCFQIIVMSIGNPYKGLLQRYIDFKKLSIIDIVKNVSLFSLTWILLIFNYGLFAVVLANIFVGLLGSLLLFYFGRRKSHVKLLFLYNHESIKPFLHFLKYYSGKISISYFSQNVDSLIIGLFLSESTLGLYYFGKNIIDKFRVLLTNSLTSFLFPFFAEIKNDLFFLKRTYLKTLDIMSLFSFVFPLYIYSAAKPMVLFLFGDEWGGSIIVFKVISLTMIFTLITNNISTSILYAIGKVKFLFHLDLISNFIYLILLYNLSRFGLIYVLGVRFIFTLLVSIICHLYVNRALKISNIKLLTVFGGRLGISLIIALVSHLLIELPWVDFDDLGDWIIISLIFAVTYFVYLYIVENRSFERVVVLVRKKYR